MVCDLELNPNSQGLDRVMFSREEQVENNACTWAGPPMGTERKHKQLPVNQREPSLYAQNLKV